MQRSQPWAGLCHLRLAVCGGDVFWKGRLPTLEGQNAVQTPHSPCGRIRSPRPARKFPAGAKGAGVNLLVAGEPFCRQARWLLPSSRKRGISPLALLCRFQTFFVEAFLELRREQRLPNTLGAQALFPLLKASRRPETLQQPWG